MGNAKRQGAYRRPTLWRPLLVMGVFLVLFGGVVGRLMDVAVLRAEGYVRYGESQRLRTQVIQASRGSILDRNEAELALSTRAFAVVVDPTKVTDPNTVTTVLTTLLPVSNDFVADKLSRNSAFEYIARQVNAETAEIIAANELVGVHLRAEPTRAYPSGDMARAILGSADVDGVGISGLEAQFNDLLAGEAGEVYFERSLNGVSIPFGDHRLRPERPGDDLVLSLDRSLQYLSDEVLEKRIAETGAQGGILILMVPQTGEILAMSNFSRDSESGEILPSQYNRAVVDSFAPGSVVKVVTIGASLEEGLSNPNRWIDVPYGLEVGDHLFQDSSLHGTESWTVTKVLVESSNVGTIKLALELGRSRVGDYLDKFGFGQLTGIGFPGESTGVVRSPETWQGSDIAGVSIGTGITATALQVLSAYSAIANGGVYMPPRLLNGHIDAQGRHHPALPAEPRRVVSTATARSLAEMLGKVVSEGTGHLAEVPGYEVAGKTGTSWKLQANGSFENAAGERDYMATFVGFAPLDNPRVGAIVVLDQPTTEHSGGSAAAPAFAEIMEHALRLLDVPSQGSGVANGGLAALGSDADLVRGAPATSGGNANG